MLDFPEDDELDLENELGRAEESVDMLKRDLGYAEERRHHLRKKISKRQLDPLVAKALWLAQNMGHALGANEALGKKVEFLQKRIAVRDEKLEEQSDYSEIKARAETAEAKLARRRRR